MVTDCKFVPGTNIPLVGLGLSGIFKPDTDEVIEDTVETALEIGYRTFDTAYSYMNEEPIGDAFKRAFEAGLVKRQDIFVISKLPGIAMHPDRVEEFLRKSLKNLQLDYVDAYLIHWPIGFMYYGDPKEIFPKKDERLDVDYDTDLIAIWKSMESVVEKGLVKHIGLSNFNEEQICRINQIARIRPYVLEIELNVHFQQKSLVEFCKNEGIAICAYAPLGSPGRTELYQKRGLLIHIENLLEDTTLAKLADTKQKTPAQIAIRFLIQQGIAVIPKSVKKERLQSNFMVMDFTLTEDEMETLRGLDRGEKGRTFDFAFSPEAQRHPEFPFRPNAV